MTSHQAARAASTDTTGPDRLAELTAFVAHEGWLLDNDRLDEWQALFAEGGHYWIPLAYGQEDALNHASIAYEDVILRDVRIRRLREKRAWSQQPVTHSTRLIGHVLVLEGDADRARITAPFQMVEWRKRREQRLVAGRYTWDLVRAGEEWKIACKRVDLVNCDAIHDNFEIFV